MVENRVDIDFPVEFSESFADKESTEINICSPSAQITTLDLKNKWGKPTAFVCLSDGKEVWSYLDSSERWSGLLIGIVVPIPLAAPIRSNLMDFHIANGYVTKAVIPQEFNAGCMYVASMSAANGSWDTSSSGCVFGQNNRACYVIPTGGHSPEIESGRVLPSMCKKS